MTQVSYETYLQAKQQNPGKYPRDLAGILGVSEAELTEARLSHDAIRLDVDARTLLPQLEHLGGTKSITRNEYAVHEQQGEYKNQHLNGHAGLILNPRALDLRLFLSQWQTVYALTEQSPKGPRHSLQFFDAQGYAVHKIYATEETILEKWVALVEQYSAKTPIALQITPADAVTQTVADTEGLDAEWRKMTDVHQFFQILRRRNLTRQQAFRAVDDDLAYRVDNGALAKILNTASEDKNEIMIFVSNKGCVQIFTGQIEKVLPHGEWINVFNSRFTLHVVESAIAESWVTRKPTKDGFVTSLELFAADGSQIAQLFGQRTEGQPEQSTWREQISALIAQGVAA
ncbi:hemin-degrading factor [Serratia sp. M24T3]|uniref:hemin-degrading factor n=1 Tax=Serratia sp. M24T3 TaxID=932213 RepID=UPI00025B9311|nr:hemin-degrading factor [Serratia sp. M24T3]EIC85494.1 hemin-degrading family protein [Serratia sp. M24T3]